MRATSPTYYLSCLLSCLALAVVLGLAGCGAPNVNAGAPAATGSPGSATLNGCKVQQAPANLPPADVILTQSSGSATPTSDFTQHVTVRQGQVIELRLPASIRWGMSTRPSGAILEVRQPESWYDSSYAVCVWRLHAAGVGVTRMNLSGGPVCPPQQACPAYAVIAQYEITVQ
jgi:hypothetical protein